MRVVVRHSDRPSDPESACILHSMAHRDIGNAIAIQVLSHVHRLRVKPSPGNWRCAANRHQPGIALRSDRIEKIGKTITVEIGRARVRHFRKGSQQAAIAGIQNIRNRLPSRSMSDRDDKLRPAILGRLPPAHWIFR